jgi:hypothetical protein
MGGSRGPVLTAAAAGLGGWGVPQGRAFAIAAWARVGLQGLVHLLTDDIHQTLEDLLHIDVLLGTGLKELKPCVDRRWGPHEPFWSDRVLSVASLEPEPIPVILFCFNFLRQGLTR